MTRHKLQPPTRPRSEADFLESAICDRRPGICIRTGDSGRPARPVAALPWFDWCPCNELRHLWRTLPRFIAAQDVLVSDRQPVALNYLATKVSFVSFLSRMVGSPEEVAVPLSYSSSLRRPQSTLKPSAAFITPSRVQFLRLCLTTRTLS